MLGVEGLYFWKRTESQIEGDYDPNPGTEGIATVTAGEH